MSTIVRLVTNGDSPISHVTGQTETIDHLNRSMKKTKPKHEDLKLFCLPDILVEQLYCYSVPVFFEFLTTNFYEAGTN